MYMSELARSMDVVDHWWLARKKHMYNWKAKIGGSKVPVVVPLMVSMYNTYNWGL